MKNVSFDLNKNQEYFTYSLSEYNREAFTPLNREKMTTEEWIGILNKLNNFKLNEMVVHRKSINNIRLHFY